MNIITIDCTGITSEPDFWRTYLHAAKPSGGHLFGCNLDAFRDAVTGGPGWPGECQLSFVNTESLRGINDGRLYQGIKSIAAISSAVSIRIG